MILFWSLVWNWKCKSLNFWWKSIKFVILQFSVLLNSLNLNEKFCSLFITPGPIHFCFSQNNIPEEPVAYSRCHILLLHICTLYFALFHSTLCQNDRKLFTMLLKVQYRKVPIELWLYKTLKNIFKSVCLAPKQSNNSNPFINCISSFYLTYWVSQKKI